MSITRAEYEALKSRATAPVAEGWKDGALTVFVAGPPKNPLNGSHQHWSKRAKWAKGWRERTAQRFWEIDGRRRLRVDEHYNDSDRPKKITFTVHGPSRFDSDGLSSVCKPVRDALMDISVIHSDAATSGHVFVYEQAKPTRKAGSVHGIAVRVELL